MGEKEFDNTSFHQQLEYLFRYGKHIASRESARGLIRLIFTPGFLVEIVYEPDKETIYEIDRIKDQARIFTIYSFTLSNQRDSVPTSNRIDLCRAT